MASSSGRRVLTMGTIAVEANDKPPVARVTNLELLIWSY